ncbi:MAG: FMN-binding protein [Actinobacteria bacterium]|nr:FMN-binding protein [Actinomycetota bacterium]MCL5445907.1 FMN-binding protein [Actinomycetota bacterium]
MRENGRILPLPAQLPAWSALSAFIPARRYRHWSISEHHPWSDGTRTGITGQGRKVRVVEVGAPNTNGNSPAQPPSAGTSSAARSATGATEQFGYGALAVKVAVSGNKIIRVSVPYIQVADSYSGNIASQVIPMLRSQVLSLQSARINGVSGATYTSEAYAMSLQSALDKLHVK